MADVYREEVMQRLVEVLQTITGSRTVNGLTFSYPNDPQVITELKQNEQINHRPTIQVVEGSGSTFQIETLNGGADGFRHRIEVLLVGYVTADATATAATWRRRLWADVVKTLMENMTLLTNSAQKVSSMEVGPLETDEGLLAPEGEFVQPLTITGFESFVTA